MVALLAAAMSHGWTAFFYVVAVVLLIVAALCDALGVEYGEGQRRRPAPAVGFIALGLAAFIFPSLWNALDAA